jgi:hypothetical protein
MSEYDAFHLRKYSRIIVFPNFWFWDKNLIKIWGYIFIYGLFNDNFNNSDHTSLNDRMIRE